MRKLADENDHEGLIRHIARTMQKEISADMVSVIKEELKRHPWEEAHVATEILMDMKGYDLREHLWKSVLDALDSAHLRAVNDRKNSELANARAGVIPGREAERISYDGVIRMINKIMTMTKLNPPLIVNYEMVTYNHSTVSGCDIDEWKRQGRPRTWSILLDLYLKGYERSLQRGECFETYAKTFDAYLDGLYATWTEERNKEKREKLKQFHSDNDSEG